MFRTLCVAAACALFASCSSSAPAAPTTVPVTTQATSTAQLLVSACATGMSRADVRAALVAMGKTPAAVEVDLRSFDDLC